MQLGVGELAAGVVDGDLVGIELSLALHPPGHVHGFDHVKHSPMMMARQAAKSQRPPSGVFYYGC